MAIFLPFKVSNTLAARLPQIYVKHLPLPHPQTLWPYHTHPHDPRDKQTSKSEHLKNDELDMACDGRSCVEHADTTKYYIFVEYVNILGWM